MIFYFISAIFYIWALTVRVFGYWFNLIQFQRSENIILNLTPIYVEGALLWTLISSAIGIYLIDRKHFGLDVAIVILLIWVVIAFIPSGGPSRLGPFEPLIILFMPFMTWLGTLTWAIILIVYRLYLMEQKRLEKTTRRKPIKPIPIPQNSKEKTSNKTPRQSNNPNSTRTQNS